MDCEELGAEGCEGVDGVGDGVGDVVEFEVEEDAEAGFTGIADYAGAFSAEELEADFDPGDAAVEGAEDFAGLAAVGDVEGEDELFFC